MKQHNKMYFLMLLYGLSVAIVATCIYGLNKEIYIGLLLGIGSLIVNHRLLIYVIDGIIANNMAFTIFPIGLGRFLIFGFAGWLAFRQSHLCVLLFAVGILAMPIAAFIDSIWEVKHD